MGSLKNDISPLLKLAFPLALTGLVQSAVWFFETIFLAHLSPEILAAGSLVSWLFGTIAVILFGALSSINILVAHKHGAKDQEGIAHIARDGLILALILSIPATLLFWNMSPIFLWFHQPQTTVVLAQAYLHALSWGLLANFINLACLEVIMGIGHARLILLFSIVTVSLNIVWSYILIFGKFGFHAYGIAGAGWGITISSWLSTFILALFIFYNKNYKYYFRYIFKFTKPFYLMELLQIGLPMGLMYCVEVAFFFALALCMGVISSQTQAANQVALQYLGLIMSGMFAIAQAVTVRMGHLLGAKQALAASRVNFIGVSMAVIIASLVALIYWFFPGMLISIDFDLHNPNNFAIINEVKIILAVSAVFQIIESARIIYFGSLRGLKDTKFTLLISFVSFWCIALPLGYLLEKYLHQNYLRFNGAGYWLGMIIGTAASVALLHWRFKCKMDNIVKYS